MALFGKKGAAQPVPKIEEPVSPMSPPRAAKSERPHGGYGIDDAIKLMRSLPVDQAPDLVVRVIKSTLESVNVHLQDILADATRKQQGLEERMGELRGEISTLESEIDSRRKEINTLETELGETTRVRARLEAVERGGVPAPIPPPAIGGFPPGPPPPPPPRSRTARPHSSPSIEITKEKIEPAADKDGDQDESQTAGSI